MLCNPQVYFKPGCLEVALRDLKGKQRAFIVTDHVRNQRQEANAVPSAATAAAFTPGCLAPNVPSLPAPSAILRIRLFHPQPSPPQYLYDSGLSDKVTRILDEIHVQHRVSGI